MFICELLKRQIYIYKDIWIHSALIRIYMKPSSVDRNERRANSDMFVCVCVCEWVREMNFYKILQESFTCGAEKIRALAQKVCSLEMQAIKYGLKNNIYKQM